MKIDWIEKQAKKIMETIGHHAPQFIMVLPNDEVEMMLINFDESTKEKMLKMMRAYIHEHKVKEYFFINEAWTVILKEGESMGNIMPSQHPNRQEILLISHYKKDMTKTEISLHFKKEGNKIIWGDKDVFTNKMESHSRFNFFVEDPQE